MRRPYNHRSPRDSRGMATTSRDQRELDLASHLVCAVSLNLQQRRHQPRKSHPRPPAGANCPAQLYAAEPVQSACRSNANVSSCPPLVKRGSTYSTISSDKAVREGGQLTTAPGSAAGLVGCSARRGDFVVGRSLDGWAAASSAGSNTAQRPPGADPKGCYEYCSPARRLSGFESPEEGQGGTCAEQQLVKPPHQTTAFRKEPEDDTLLARQDHLLPAPALPGRDVGRMPVSGLGAVAGDALVLVCSYMEAKDIVRLSVASAPSFPSGLWRQLHLARYGPPNNGPVKALPLARLSRLQLQSDFPVHHARLHRIRRYHGLIRPMLTRGFEEDCFPRLRFAEESLRREDSSLREEEAERRLERAGARKKQHTDRAGAVQGLALAKKANTVERMAMVDMKSAVERHCYAPGRRPKIPQASSRREGPTDRGKPMGQRRNPPPSLEGLFCDD